MFKNLKMKRDLKKRIEIMYGLESGDTLIEDIWNNVYFKGNNSTEIEDFFKFLIRDYVGNSYCFELYKYKYKEGIIEIKNKLQIKYRNMIIDHIPLRIDFPRCFNEKDFKKDCYDVVKTAKKLKNKVEKNK